MRDRTKSAAPRAAMALAAALALAPCGCGRERAAGEPLGGANMDASSSSPVSGAPTGLGPNVPRADVEEGLMPGSGTPPRSHGDGQPSDSSGGKVTPRS